MCSYIHSFLSSFFLHWLQDKIDPWQSCNQFHFIQNFMHHQIWKISFWLYLLAWRFWFCQDPRFTVLNSQLILNVPHALIFFLDFFENISFIDFCRKWVKILNMWIRKLLYFCRYANISRWVKKKSDFFTSLFWTQFHKK